jgi:hypothetical protein
MWVTNPHFECTDACGPRGEMMVSELGHGLGRREWWAVLGSASGKCGLGVSSNVTFGWKVGRLRADIKGIEIEHHSGRNDVQTQESWSSGCHQWAGPLLHKNVWMGLSLSLSLFFFFVCEVLGFELRAHTLSYSASILLWRVFQNRASWTICLGWFQTMTLDLCLLSSWGLQAWAIDTAGWVSVSSL